MLRHNFKSDDSPSMISRPSIIPPYWQGGDLGGMSLPPPPPQSTPLQGQPQSQQPQTPQQTSLKAKRKRPKFIRKVQCQVCGDVANDHIHYGAIACYSCRAFFRRGVNSNAPYYCSQSKCCPVTKHTRKHCQYCRFQKCIAIGMKASWVMTEEDKQEKKEKALLKKMVKSEAPNIKEEIPAETFKLSYQRRRQNSATSSQYHHQQYPKGSPQPPNPHRQTELQRPSPSLMSPPLRPLMTPPQLPIMGIRPPSFPPYGLSPYSMSATPDVRLRHHLAIPRDVEERLIGYPRDVEERHAGYPRDVEERHAAYRNPRDVEERHVAYRNPRDVEERHAAGFRNPEPLSSPASPREGEEEEEAVDLSNNSLDRSHTEETENAVINANLTAPQTEPSPMEEEQLQADTKLTLSFLEVSALSQDPVRPFGESEKALVAMLISTEYEAAKSVEINPEIAECFIAAAKNGAEVPYHILVEGYTTCMRRIVKFASALDIFNTFEIADQRQMLLNNTGMLVNIRTARFLKPDRDLKDQLKIMSDSANLDENQQRSASNKGVDSVRIRYKQIFQSPFACSEADEERFAALMERVFELEMDRVTTAFMSLMALFSTTYAKIKEESLALERQEFFANLLYRYLVEMIGMEKARELLPKYIRLLAELQEMAQIMITKCLKY